MERSIQALLEEAKRTSVGEITNQRFRIQAPPEEVLQILKNLYEADVIGRGRVFDNDEETDRRLRSVTKWLTSGTNRPSLLLYGGVGSGKSTMAQAIAGTIDLLRDLADEYERKACFGIADDRNPEARAYRNQLKAYKELPTPRIATAQRITKLAKEDPQRLKTLLDTRFLIIDDLGCEPVAVKNWGTEETPVIDIIYNRYETMSTTVITTNLDLKDIRELYGERVADRMSEAYDTLAFKGDSYRKRR